MTSFSDRYGLSRKALQIDYLDGALRGRLWNAVYTSYRGHIYYSYQDNPNRYYGEYWGKNPQAVHDFRILIFTEALIDKLMKRPLYSNNMRKATLDKQQVMDSMRSWILEKEWNRVYDLIEYLPNHYPDQESNTNFRAAANRALEDEHAGYRFIGDVLVRITAEEELKSIEESLELTGPFATVSEHLRQALQLLSDREAPDYRNSIKESISAVEAACNIVSGKSKATLGDALKAIEDETAHPVLKASFEKLYGWTSDASGIRHALADEPNVGFAEAQFMVVACSAFTNYLATKSAKSSS